ncbi:hypothetical protein [Bradyrhizobium sp. USDA 3458]|uniref:hypothetical protein n=1 Tax=Bradyrhizobium sp. USDA 3458 TaxID=2591461 RepID=UPI0011437521|nr:hypothetical protein [Bradyrhizobium sp. USDA 3458]
MRRRIEIHIGHLVVDQGTGLGGRSVATAIEYELAARLRQPNAAARLAPENAGVLNGGAIGQSDAAIAIGRRIGAVLAGEGKR